MKEYIDILSNSIIFKGIKKEEIEGVLGCLNAQKKQYKKGELIFRAGEPIKKVAVVIKGNIHIIKNDFWGNKSILTDVEAGEMFGESFALLDGENIGIDAEAMTDVTIIFFDVKKIMTTCGNNCDFHNKIIMNFVRILANKNYTLTRKVEQVTQRGMRNKLMAFLSDQAAVSKSNTFDIPFNRQQLADYLSVDRSAMSNELSKMKDEGIIDYYKNSFKIM